MCRGSTHPNRPVGCNTDVVRCHRIAFQSELGFSMPMILCAQPIASLSRRLAPRLRMRRAFRPPDSLSALVAGGGR
jgi:hypothetical protein